MIPSTFHSRDVATVPHASSTQLTQIMQTAGDPGQQAELIQQTSSLVVGQKILIHTGKNSSKSRMWNLSQLVSILHYNTYQSIATGMIERGLLQETYTALQRDMFATSRTSQF